MGKRDNGFIPCVARLVMHPTALHWTSTLGDSIWRMRGSNPPSFTISNLFSAVTNRRQRKTQREKKKSYDTCEPYVLFDIFYHSPTQVGFATIGNVLLTAKLPRAAEAAR